MPDLDLDAPETPPTAVAQLAAAELVRRTGVERHDIALTLGSGWGRAAERLGEIVARVPADEVPGFTASGIPGHSGQLTSIRLANGLHALVIGARTHFYEGRGVRRVVHSVRTAAAAGAKVMVLTNGAGGIDPSWSPGTPVLISDHINLTAASPLEGATFIDVTDLYSSRLRALAREVDPSLDEGVYVQFRGPQFETPAEVRMARTMGGTIVGMSTALEAIAAREAGVEVFGISLITNLAAGISDSPLNHEEVLEAGRNAEEHLAGLLSRIVGRIAESVA
ncbi:purine-nucleoside phosphorylase [Amnibacterium endophyticum]|uniref:Purine nucleoside phosphorylase n=1 Tax=Amnibacterium endophyticum TaxID=2109337 RepID=A0ABW4LC61_9MICO